MKAWWINEQVEESDWRDGGRVRRVEKGECGGVERCEVK